MQMSVASLLPADSQGMIVSFNYALQVYFVNKKKEYWELCAHLFVLWKFVF
jgi:hypothetical protein